MSVPDKVLLRKIKNREKKKLKLLKLKEAEKNVEKGMIITLFIY